ncbi:MAG: TerB family tellurite resistance protein [Candidatus Aureabacteria bacterium]|nr:TerB family tellurite resistance protein [Candidatus Auribacterota bacterium]
MKNAFIDNLKSLFAKPEENTTGNTAGKIRLASCVLFIEAAATDGRIDESERKVISGILEKDFGLDKTGINALLEEAQGKREDSVDLYEFTKVIDKNFSYDEKLAVLKDLWKIIFADRRLDKYEDQLIHKIAGLLKVSHRDLIDVKMQVKEGSGRE